MDQHLKAQRVNILTPPLAPFTRSETTTRQHALHTWISAHWEWLLIGAILLIAGLAHGINMFHFPFYHDDEGTYMAQAWAILHEGQLAPYTYWYDHAPAGWIQIALWELLTGGPHTFGGAIRSGRVLMLLFHIGSVYFVYRIARDVSGKVLPAILATLLFTLSPYELYYGRQVLLDNICTFWLLLSVMLLTRGRIRLGQVWFSALALAISILSKELAVFAIPALAYLVYWRSGRGQRVMAAAIWITSVCSICSLYVLMAFIKSELFPVGTLLGGNAPHVSLLGSLAFQASRGKDGGIFQSSSSFWQNAHIWIHDEPTLVIAGTLAAVIAALSIKRRRLPGILSLVLLSLWAFLARGGGDIGFYIVPLLPLLALNLALSLDIVESEALAALRQFRQHYARNIVSIASLAAICLGVAMTVNSLQTVYSTPQEPLLIWTNKQANVQSEAAAWISQRIPVNDTVIVDMSMWAALHENRSSLLVFDRADYYWKLERDPAIRLNVYHGSWRDIDYIVTTPQMLIDESANHMTIVADALAHCVVVAHFDTGGWPVNICMVLNGRVPDAGLTPSQVLPSKSSVTPTSPPIADRPSASVM